MSFRDGKLLCDGWCKQALPVSKIDAKGFAYCDGCGTIRKDHGHRCRKLKPSELKRLQAGLAIPRY